MSRGPFRISNFEAKVKSLNRPLDTAAAEPKTKTQPIDTHNHIEAEHDEAKPQRPGTKKSDDDRVQIHIERKQNRWLSFCKKNTLSISTDFRNYRILHDVQARVMFSKNE